jgi:hypothetical protein
MGFKRALIVGMVYPDNKPECPTLSCVYNHVLYIRDCLIKRYGFPAENVTVMMDDETSLSSCIPTLQNVMDHLYDMILKSKAGDISVCYLSGHGGRFTVEDPDTKQLDYVEYFGTANDTFITGTCFFFLLFFSLCCTTLLNT